VSILQGDRTSAVLTLAQCMDTATASANDRALAHAQHLLGSAALLGGDYAGATTLLTEALSRYDKLGAADSNTIMARVEFAIVALRSGQPDAAIQICTDVHAVCEASGEQWARGYASYVLALAAWGRRATGEAAAHTRAFLAASHACHDAIGIALAFELAAVLANGRDDRDTAAVLLGAASTIWRRVGQPLLGSACVRGLHDRCLRRTRAALTEPRFTVLYGRGAGLPEDEAVAQVLGHDDAARPGRGAPMIGVPAGDPGSVPSAARPAGPRRRRAAPARAASAWPPLSRRECQVAALVAEGLSNRAIADRLLIAKRTADAHVEHILAKLAFVSRAQVAAWVTERYVAGGGWPGRDAPGGVAGNAAC
jgi:non-specific serine/threonine protein kinase